MFSFESHLIFLFHCIACASWQTWVSSSVCLSTCSYVCLPERPQECPSNHVFFETCLLREELTVFQVILTGHVPPGYTTPRKVRWMTKVLNQKFVDVILRHSDVIVAMHFGHEHHDNFRLFYNKESMHIQTCFSIVLCLIFPCCPVAHIQKPILTVFCLFPHFIQQLLYM